VTRALSACVIALVCAATARADDTPPISIRYEIESKQVVQGETFQLDVVVRTTMGQIDELELPSFRQFSVLRENNAQSTQVELRNGKRSATYEMRYSYLLRAYEPGKRTVEAGRARAGKSTAQAAPLTLEVIASNESAEPSASGGRTPGARFGKSPPQAFLEVTPEKDSVYVGEQLTVTTELYTTQPLSQWPRLPSLRPQGFLCTSLLGEERPQPKQRTVAGKSYYVYLANKDALFPVSAGKQSIPAQQVDVVPAGSLFSRSRPFAARSEARLIDVKPLPDEGRPARFSAGNVGSFRIDASARPTVSTFGQPFTLSISVSGRGSLEQVEVPTWDGGDLARVFPPTKKIERASSDEVIAGKVTLEMLVQPNKEGALTVPALSMWTFDPDIAATSAEGARGGWVELRTKPIAITVRARSGAAAASSDGATGARQLIARGARPLKSRVTAEARATDVPVYAGAGALALGSLAFVVGEARRRRRGSATGRAADERRARTERLEDAIGRADLTAMERALLDVLAARFSPAVRSHTTTELAPFLVERGLDEPAAAAVVDAIRALEAGRYAPGGAAERKKLAESVREIARTIEGGAP
jgi:hypothetical protein